MNAIAIIAIGAAFVLAIGYAVSVASVEVDALSSSPLGRMFVYLEPDRPRGVPEEDLPRFVFRDRVPLPAGAGTAPAGVGLGPALEVGAC